MADQIATKTAELGALDGRIAPSDELVIPVTDEGLLRGDGGCARCHSPGAAQQAPGNFASADVNEAYGAARSKINLDDPESSRFVNRLLPAPLGDGHNCWVAPNGNCTASAALMLAAIQAFAGDVPVTEINPELQVSRALTLFNGTIAAGGSRFEDHTIAKYQFKDLIDGEIIDTSGVEP